MEVYSQAVACGLGSECTDHSPVVVQVAPGAEISGVDICDWYAPGDVPSNPASPENAVGQEPAGSVSGRLCYPSEFIPEMTIFFQEINSQDITPMATTENQESYNSSLPAGQYIAFAYLNSGAPLGGSYSKAVICGLGATCTDHSLVQFSVQSRRDNNWH